MDEKVTFSEQTHKQSGLQNILAGFSIIIESVTI